jgi:hypothetical protein
MAVTNKALAAKTTPTYTLAVDLLAGIVAEALHRDGEALLERARRRERALVEAHVLEADYEEEADRATRAEIAKLFDCEPGDVTRVV